MLASNMDLPLRSASTYEDARVSAPADLSIVVVLGADVQEYRCRRWRARIRALDNTDLLLDPHVSNRHHTSQSLLLHWRHR